MFLIGTSAQLNMRGVFLHVLGDALGSVIVIISGLVIKFVKQDWTHKVDPAMRYALKFNRYFQSIFTLYNN